MLTVMTPTYNRERTLPACYKSLLSQTDKRFVWMIIDDGSVDNTEQIVQEWIDEKQIEIVYLKKENGGKASALNYAFQHLTTPYACCLDSDDIFYPNTVELAISQLDVVKDDSNCCGVIAISSNMDGTPMGGVEIPHYFKTIKITDILHLGRGIELVRLYKTDILKQYAFPIFSGEKFVSPAWIDYEINRKYYFVPSWDKMIACEYQADGLTVNKRAVIVKNPHGYTSVKRQSFEFANTLKGTVKHGIMYNCGCIIGHDKNWLKNSPKKFWTVILRPFAWIVYLRRFRKLCKN